MKYYSREVTRREAINKYGRLGCVLYVEYVKLNKESELAELNKGKRIRFEETSNKELIRELRKGEINKVYSKKAV